MDSIMVKAKETITDQYEVVRIIRNKEYILLHEFDETYLIIDENKKELNLGREYFYASEDD